MTYFIIFIAVLLGGFLIYFWIKRNWRKTATVLAAVYQNYSEKYDSKEAFIKSLEFRYKPPRIVDITPPDEVPNISKAVGIDRLKLYARYAGVLIAKGLKDVLDKYLSMESFDNARAIDISSFQHQQDMSEVASAQIYNPRFQYNKDDYSITELIYCFLVIEYPKTVALLSKELATKVIDNFLEFSQNAILATARDPALIKDVEAVERL